MKIFLKGLSLYIHLTIFIGFFVVINSEEVSTLTKTETALFFIAIMVSMIFWKDCAVGLWRLSERKKNG